MISDHEVQVREAVLEWERNSDNQTVMDWLAKHPALALRVRQILPQVIAEASLEELAGYQSLEVPAKTVHEITEADRKALRSLRKLNPNSLRFRRKRDWIAVDRQLTRRQIHGALLSGMRAA